MPGGQSVHQVNGIVEVFVEPIGLSDQTAKSVVSLQTTLLVLAPAAAGARIVSSRHNFASVRGDYELASDQA